MTFCTDPHGVDLFVQWMERGLRAPAANQSNQCIPHIHIVLIWEVMSSSIKVTSLKGRSVVEGGLLGPASHLGRYWLGKEFGLHSCYIYI